jgi:hypothetical protein
MVGSSSGAAQLAASQEELSSMELLRPHTLMDSPVESERCFQVSQRFLFRCAAVIPGDNSAAICMQSLAGNFLTNNLHAASSRLNNKRTLLLLHRQGQQVEHDDGVILIISASCLFINVFQCCGALYPGLFGQARKLALFNWKEIFVFTYLQLKGNTACE